MFPTVIMRRGLIFAIALAGMVVLTSQPANIAQDATPIPTLDPALGVMDPSEFEPTTDFPDSIPGAIGPVYFPPGVNPLTGLPVSDPVILEQRPVLAKVSNGPPLVRPQHGLGQADIVYEHYTEGGITRFSAIFLTQTPTKLGSVRSARLIDYELAEMYKALPVYSGASIGVQERLEGSEFADRLFHSLAYGNPVFWRESGIDVPHNLFADLTVVRERADRLGFRQRPLLRGMAFHPDPPPGGTDDGQSIDIRYRATRVQWRYNPDEGNYYRWADGQPHFDAGLNMQLSAENVVIIYAGHYLTDIVEAVYRGGVSYSTQITIWPQGHAELFRDGRRYAGQWVRLSRPDLLGLRTDDGELLYLKPGRTWFQVVQLPEQMNPIEEWTRWE